MKLRLLPLAAALLLCAGCAGREAVGEYRELDQLVLVDALGVDRRGEGLVVTAAASSADGPIRLRAGAATVRRALAELQSYTEKQFMFYGHTRHLLLGEADAGACLERCLEFVERSDEVRLDTWLFLVRDGTAEDAVTKSAADNVGDLLDALVKDVELTSVSRVFTCGETAEALAERGCALVSAVRLTEAENIVPESKRLTLLSAGYGVVADGRLTAWLDPDMARGANLLMDSPGGDVIEAPDGRGGVFAARLTGSDARFLPEYRDGEPVSLRILLELRCSLAEISGPPDLMEGETLREMEAAIAAVEAARVDRVLRLSQTLKADFCGLGDGVRRASPLRFARTSVTWKEVFPALPITAEVRVKLERGGEGGVEGLPGEEQAAG